MSGEVTESEVRELIRLLVRGANDNMDSFIKSFGSDVLKNSLALILTDMEKEYGFLVRAGRFSVIEGSEAENATAVIRTTKDFFIEFLESDNWVGKAIEGYNTYKAVVSSSDGRDYIHYKNLMEIIKWVQGLVEGGEG